MWNRLFQYQRKAEPLTYEDAPVVPTLDGWLPQAVDQVPRRRALSAAVLATAICTLVPLAVVADGATDVAFPDQIRGARGTHASLQQAFALDPAPIVDAPVVPEQWAPQYPSRFLRPPALSTAAQQSLAFAPEPIAAAPETPELSWAPHYPEQITRAFVHASLQQALAFKVERADQTASAASDSGVITRPTWVQYQQLTAPVLVPAAFPELSWAPTFPEQHLRAQRVAASQSVAPVAPKGDGDLRWQAQYPERVDGRAYSVALHQALAFDPEPLPDAAPAPELSWAPGYPDQHLRALTPVTAHQPLAWDPTANTAPEFAWQPGYPSLLLPAGRLLTSAQQFYAANLDPIADRLTDLSWGPRYPVAIDREVVHPAHLPWLAAPVAPLAPPLLSWAPEYPDRLVRRAPEPRSLTVVPLLLPSFGDLRWLATYPDQHLRRRIHASQQQALAFRVTLEADPLPDLAWQADYPDLIARAPYDIALRTFHVDPPTPALPVPELAWQGQYPERIVRLAFLPGRQQAFTLHPVPIAAVTVAELSWLAHYPDGVERPALLTALQQAFAANIDPIAVAALVPLSWDPHYPSLLLPLPRVRALGTDAAAPPLEIEEVVQGLVWAPHYPDIVRRKLPDPEGPWPTVPIDLVTLANAYTCIELCVDAQQAGLRNLRVTQSSLEGAAVTSITGPGFTIC